jgi:hypothetical protein
VFDEYDYYFDQTHRLNDSISIKIHRTDSTSVFYKIKDDLILDSIENNMYFYKAFVSHNLLYLNIPSNINDIYYLLDENLNFDTINGFDGTLPTFYTYPHKVLYNKQKKNYNSLVELIDKDSTITIYNYGIDKTLYIYNYESPSKNLIQLNNNEEFLLIRDLIDTIINKKGYVKSHILSRNKIEFNCIAKDDSNLFSFGILDSNGFNSFNTKVIGELMDYNLYAEQNILLSIDIDSIYINYFTKEWEKLSHRSFPKWVDITRISNSSPYSATAYGFFDDYEISLHPDSTFSIDKDERVEYVKINDSLAYYFIKSKFNIEKVTILAYSGHAVYEYPRMFNINEEVIWERSNIVIPIVRGSIQNGISSYLNGVKEKKLNTINDIITVSKLFRDDYKLYYYGESHGGFIGTNIALREPNLFEFIIVQNPVLDVKYLSSINYFSHRDFGASEFVYENLSPINLIDKKDSIGNLIMFFGDLDDFTPRDSRNIFYKKARKINPKVELHVVDSVHHLYMAHPKYLRKWYRKQYNVIDEKYRL